ncbi:histidinol-phosphate transaminase [Corynebacterium poyangense]|uniref:Histidinol-phosphate aminotransferase n=1 Tax=Corynebacterium poyangense TaxID=2684405 RepID=A0A7H0SLD4_9CORY|nr:histidinol-phosphate transaminase [Corynebacterium poyangense]MBZ8177451.1 histidinol-phosphate transaminase [Corynebacterium poyangense]QNQ89359.1 histidinol-phosphate transaminase [Corynebacterium poyangense]
MIRPDIAQLPLYLPGEDAPEAVKLSSNELARFPLPELSTMIMGELKNPHRYPDNDAVALKKALAQHLGLDVNQIAVGTGSSALCQQLVQVTCTDGDEVIFPWRSFEAYPLFARVHGAVDVAVPLQPDQSLDLDAMANAVTDRTRLIFVCNPNNPSGTTITQAQFAEFMGKVPKDIVVALDEAYFEYNQAEDTPNAVEEIKNYENLIGLRTFSKAWGLAGLRVGYAFGNPRIIEAIYKVAPVFSVSTIAQAAAKFCLEHKAEILSATAETIQQRDRAAVAVGAQPSQGNFIWLPMDDPSRAKKIANAMAEEGIILRPFPEGLRISITNEEETTAFLEAWKRLSL